MAGSRYNRERISHNIPYQFVYFSQQLTFRAVQCHECLLLPMDSGTDLFDRLRLQVNVNQAQSLLHAGQGGGCGRLPENARRGDAP